MSRWRLRAAGLATAGAVLALGVALVGCGSDQAVAPDPDCDARPGNCVTIGVGEPIPIGTLLFPGDPSGEDTLNTITLALDYLDGAFDAREGEVLGHRVEVISGAENCTPAGGRAGARRLLAESADLVAVIGPTCSAAAFRAAATVLSQRRVLMVSPTATSPLLAQPEGRERYFFRTAFNDLLQAAVVADFARDDLRARRAATLAMNDPYSSVLADAFADAFRADGGTITTRQVVGAGGSMDAAASGIARTRPNAIFLPLFQPGCGRALRAIRAQPDLASTPVVVSESCLVTSFTEGVADANVYAAAPVTARVGRGDFYRTEFLPAYRQRFSASPSGVFTAQAFDAINLVIGAVRRVAVPLPGGGLRINRAQLRAAILDVDGYEGVSGNLTCIATGDCVQSARIAVYRAPDWPLGGRRATPVFSASRSLAEVRGQASG
jgi:branched-chain amino acid transport system substrate-binding protein